VEKVLDVSGMRLKPGIAVAETGLTPMSPVTADAETVEIPVLVRMTKALAEPSRTGAGGGGATARAIRVVSTMCARMGLKEAMYCVGVGK
jgi:hypothetical protein